MAWATLGELKEKPLALLRLGVGTDLFLFLFYFSDTPLPAEIWKWDFRLSGTFYWVERQEANLHFNFKYVFCSSWEFLKYNRNEDGEYLVTEIPNQRLD